MTPLTMGMYAMIGIGGCTLLFSLWVFSRHGELKRSLPPPLLGVLLIGVGTFGPSFMADFGSFLSTLRDASGNWNDDKVESALVSVAQGKRNEGESSAILALVREDPPKNFEKMLDNAIKSSTNDRGRAMLEATKKDYRLSVDAAKKMLEEAAKKDDALINRKELDLRTLRAIDDAKSQLKPEKLSKIKFVSDPSRER